jgi:linoleoyl-CoA desaturase
MNLSELKFDNQLDREFASTLRNRVNEYFTKSGIEKTGNSKLHVQAFLSISIYVLSFLVLIASGITNPWVLMGLWVLMGFGKAVIGTGIMHDAIHGSFSGSNQVNKTMGLSMNLIGGNSWVWKMQHNVLHHTYTNLNEIDDDIDIPVLLRMSPHQPKYPWHRYQHIYVWLLYAFATIFWVTSKDFVQLNKYRDRGLLKEKDEYGMRLMNIVLWKLVYYAYSLVLPILVMPVSWVFVLIGWVVMHLVAGIVLSLIFQPAHVFPDSEFLDHVNPKLKNSYTVHQFMTTTNFQLKNRILDWMAGGLNYQIEHHLFPNICHVHYEKISPIVASTAQEYKIPYYNEKSIWKALQRHGAMLKKLGTEELVAA